MLTVEQIRARLEVANIQRVAARAVVHPSVIYRLMQGDTIPSYDTVKKLSDFYQKIEE